MWPFVQAAKVPTFRYIEYLLYSLKACVYSYWWAQPLPSMASGLQSELLKVKYLSIVMYMARQVQGLNALFVPSFYASHYTSFIKYVKHYYALNRS